MFQNLVFYRVWGPSAAENFTMAMLKNVSSMALALREGKNRKKLSRKIFFHINCLTYPQHMRKIANISPTYAQIASKMAQHRANIGQHGANIRQHRPSLGQHRPNIGQHRSNIGSTWAQDAPNVDHMGLGPT